MDLVNSNPSGVLGDLAKERFAKAALAAAKQDRLEALKASLAINAGRGATAGMILSDAEVFLHFLSGTHTDCKPPSSSGNKAEGER